MRKGKNCMLRYLRPKSKFCSHEIVEEKGIHASFAVAPHSAKVKATVLGKGLVKVQRALHLWVEDTNRKHI